jgi:hypothetical protein
MQIFSQEQIKQQRQQQQQQQRKHQQQQPLHPNQIKQFYPMQQLPIEIVVPGPTHYHQSQQQQQQFNGGIVQQQDITQPDVKFQEDKERMLQDIHPKHQQQYHQVKNVDQYELFQQQQSEPLSGLQNIMFTVHNFVFLIRFQSNTFNLVVYLL